MANIRFLVKSKTNPSALYVRFYRGRLLDITSNTGYLVNPKYWSVKQQRVTTASANQLEVASINPKLIELKESILQEYNKHFAEGGMFNKDWLDRVVARFNNRPIDEGDNKEIYFVPFVSNYINDSKSRINLKTGKLIDPKTIQKYRTTLKRLEEFQEKEGVVLKLWDIDLNFLSAFLKFLRIDNGYGNTTCNKFISQIKGFCREAKSKGLKVSPEIEHRNFTVRREAPIDVYLNKEEIRLIFEADFKDNDRLNNVRQLMIIGLWTGLRISDLKRIHDFNFTKNRIEILDSVKTGNYIDLPIHPQVKAVIAENKGKLPRVISDVKFNLYMKEVCKAVGITNRVMGNKKNPKTNRKEKGYYPKYELVSSHTCRRSFATNHYGELSNLTIMAITNHKSEQQFIKYVKTSRDERVQELQKHWDSQPS